MHAKKLPLKRGFFWLLEGGRLWWRNPPLITGLMLAYFLLLVLIASIPLVGPLSAALLMPVLWLMVLNGCRALDRNARLRADALFTGMTRQRISGLLMVGLLYFLCNILVYLVFFMLDAALLEQLEEGVSIHQALAQNPEALLKFMGLGVLTMPFMMAYWFAPMLCGWWSVPPFKAFFFSFYACLQNWQPFVGFLCGLVFAGIVLPQLMIRIVAIISPILAGLFSIIFMLVFFSVLFTAFYTSARDIFDFPADA